MPAAPPKSGGAALVCVHFVVFRFSGGIVDPRPSTSDNLVNCRPLPHLGECSLPIIGSIRIAPKALNNGEALQSLSAPYLLSDYVPYKRSAIRS